MKNSSTGFPADDEAIRAMLHFGLSRAIQLHSEEIRANHPQLKLEFDLVDDENMLPEPVVLALFRVYQEAINNIERHAQASSIWIRYYPDGNAMTLVIRDDGKGFSIPADWAKFASTRSGVMGMKKRIEAIGGNLNITSEPGQGTQIHVTVPLPEEKVPGKE